MTDPSSHGVRATSPVDRAEPPFRQVARQIRERIERGELKAGDHVPSAREIMKVWGVSNATATRVLAALQSEGLTRGIVGVGTVVVPADERAAAQAAVASAVVVRDGLVLMTCRRRAEGTLLWAFPGGEIEPGERPEAAARREVHEELDLSVEPLRVLGERNHPATGRHMVYVACAYVHGYGGRIVDTDELIDYRWLTRAHVAALVPHGLFGPVQAWLDRVVVAQGVRDPLPA